MRINRKLRWLVYSNLASLLVLAALLFRVPAKIKARLTRIKPAATAVTGQVKRYSPWYASQLSLYDVYPEKQVDIVMLGNSITYEAQWQELLGRADVVNRGINADITEGLRARMEYVYRLHPKVCFVMGGINDIFRGRSVQEAADNLISVLEGLKEKGITPVLQTTLYIAKEHADRRFGAYLDRAEEINGKVDRLNTATAAFCRKNGIQVLNTNRLLANGHALHGQYTYDGVHLRGKGYLVWKKAVENTLTELGI